MTAANVTNEFEDIRESARQSAGVLTPWRNLLLRRHRPQLVTAVMIPFFQEWTGLGALVIFGPEIFRRVPRLCISSLPIQIAFDRVSPCVGSLVALLRFRLVH